MSVASVFFASESQISFYFDICLWLYVQFFSYFIAILYRPGRTRLIM